MNKLTLSKVICILFVFCAATAIASPAQVLTTLHNFAGPPNDGEDPVAGLIHASDGNFYGTTSEGGASQNCQYGCGTVFKIIPSGTLTTLYSFCSQSNCADGEYPDAGLVQASDGNFYGTTNSGGANHYGTVFKITPSGTLTTLYSFCSQTNCADGEYPDAGLVQASDGNFYGTTFNGGTSGQGIVYKITPGGTLTVLYSFCSQTNCTDGEYPHAALVQATDGNFYGTTAFGGAAGQDCPFLGCGTVFKMTPSGTLTTLYSFCSAIHCIDGSTPYAGLVQATDGNFYGTTLYGGTSQKCSNGCGTVFGVTPSGEPLYPYSFCSQSNCSDGAYPYAGLVQARDGNFYGTTSQGGTNCAPVGCGTVFKISTNSTLTLPSFLTLTTLHSFDGVDGAQPSSALIQTRDASFYGTTSSGGANGDGTVFRLVLPRPCIVCPAVE